MGTGLREQPENRGPARPGPGAETDRPTGSVGATRVAGPGNRGRRRQGPEEARGSEAAAGAGQRPSSRELSSGLTDRRAAGEEEQFLGLRLRHPDTRSPVQTGTTQRRRSVAKEDQSS